MTRWMTRNISIRSLYREYLKVNTGDELQMNTFCARYRKWYTYGQILELEKREKLVKPLSNSIINRRHRERYWKEYYSNYLNNT